jgi:hypothetical protein
VPLQQVGNSQYTQIGTNGTTTLNPGQSGIPGIGQQGTLPTTFGVLYGATLIALGTAPVITFLDIIPPNFQGTNTATVTNTIAQFTGTAVAQNFNAGQPGVGVRYRGALVAVTSGTAAGNWQVDWD